MKTSNRASDFQEVRDETELFIENAKQQHYFAPNRIIPKKDRPKWRFMVKRLFKDLLALSRDPKYLPQVSGLLERLYCLICEACGVYLFNTEDPFQSVGIEQGEFFRWVVAVKKQAFLPREWVAASIRLIVDNDTDRSMLRTGLMNILVEFLNTASLKELAIEQGDLLRREGVKSRKKTSFSDYENKQRNNDLVEMVFILQMALAEQEEAVRYFKTHHQQREKEVSLFVLLHWVFQYKLKDLWLQEHESALQQGTQPRKALRNTYQHIKETGEFPKHMW